MARCRNPAEDRCVAIKIADAARSGDLRTIKRIGKNATDSRKQMLGERVSDLCDNVGDSPLHYAALLGHAEICSYLIKQFKMDANLAASSGKTPLCFAATSGNPNTIESLIDCGADLHVKDAKGFTPLHYAAIGDNPQAIELLLSKGAQIDVQNFTGSPLLLATLLGHKSCMKVLLDHDADPNELLYGVVTPLLIAVMSNETCPFHPPDETKEVVELLIKAGADVNKIPVLGFANHSKGLTEYLLKSGAKPNLPDKFGRLPIEVAAMRGAREVISVLFPVTSPITTVSDWSISGLLSHVATEKFKKERKALSKKNMVDLKKKIKELLFQKEYLAALILCNQAIEEEPEDASLYYAKRCLCWMNLGNAVQENTGIMYLFNAATDSNSSKMQDVIQTLGMERLSELMGIRMLFATALL